MKTFASVRHFILVVCADRGHVCANRPLKAANKMISSANTEVAFMNSPTRRIDLNDILRMSRELRRGLLNPQPQRDVDGSAPFCAFQSALVPEAGGVYLIHDLRGILYVGRTINLRQRLAQHYWVTENDLLRLALRHRFGEMRFSWFLLDGGRERALLEHDLVGWLQPPCNRVTPGLPR